MAIPKKKPTISAEEDEIVQQYRGVLERVEETTSRLAWWESILRDTDTDRSPLGDLLNKWQAEMDRTKLDWEHIKPKDFALSQCRVQALSKVLFDLRDMTSDVQAELRSARTLKAQLESNYPIPLQGAGFRLDPLTPEEMELLRSGLDDEGSTNDDEDEDEDDQGEGDE